jgi:hypothetical protein
MPSEFGFDPDGLRPDCSAEYWRGFEAGYRAGFVTTMN